VIWRQTITLLLLILSVVATVWIFLSRSPLTIEQTASASVSRSFVVFDGNLFHSKPDLSRHGVKPLKIIYVREFGEEWYNGSGRMQPPDENKVKQLAREVGAKESLVAIDIEHWPLTGDVITVHESVRKYKQVARWFHEAAPALPIGFFGIVPMSAYGWSLKGPESSEYKAWQQINDRLIPLAQEVDVVFPHAYTYYSQPDQAAWVRYAEENIKEARRYGKPVYVFLWFRYETLGLNAGKDIPPSFWRLQLETVRKHADGVVIWGGWGSKGPEAWTEDAPWWQVTKQFVSQLDQSAPATPRDVVFQ
jgi:hypothetical protein